MTVPTIKQEFVFGNLNEIFLLKDQNTSKYYV